jgi:type VI secretion system protein ImpE
MQEAKALFEAGNLDAAIESLLGEVKANPTDVSRRTFLFELCCFAGQWDRADKQLDVVGMQDANAAVGVLAYRSNIQAERDRQRLFKDGLAPHFLSEPPAYVDLLLDAINRLREGNVDEARAKLDEVEETRPTFSGKLNGEAFTDFRDYNDLTGPVLELIVKGRYTWLPVEQISSIDIEQPKNLRDLIWTPARIEAKDGTVGEVFILALYAGSSEHQDDQVRLGRSTDWNQVGEELYTGAGLRLFWIDGEDKPLFQIRQIEFDLEEESAPDETKADAANEAAGS